MNKKALDYAMWLAMVTFVCIVYLFIIINGELRDFRWNVGEHEVALLNTYQKAEENLLYVDNAARLASWQSVDSFASFGGMPNEECSSIQSTAGKKYSFWNTADKNCFETANFYENFNVILGNKLKPYLNRRNIQNDYEFTVLKDKISGFALQPIGIPIQPPPEKITEYFLFFKVYEEEVPKTAVGKYYVRPSFTVNINSNLEDYNKIRDKMKNLLECSKKHRQVADIVKDHCENQIDKGNMRWQITKDPVSDIYFFDITQNFENPYTNTKPTISLAMTISQPKPPAPQAPAPQAIKAPRVA